MSVIDNLRWILSADGKEFRQEIARSEKTLKRGSRNMDRDLQRLNRGFASMRTRLFTLLGAAGIGALANQLTKTADETGKLADQLGTTSEELSTLTFAAEQNGAGLDDLRLALRRLARGIDQAEKGTGTYGQKFKELGIETRDANGELKSTTDILAEVADLFQTLPDGATKTAIAYELLGDNGQRLIPLLNQGSAGMRQLQDRARELGLEINQNTADAAAELRDQLSDLKGQVTGVGNSLLIDMLPGLNEYVRTVRFAAEESGGFMAAVVALGGIGDAVFSRSARDVRNDIKNTETELERLNDLARRMKESAWLRAIYGDPAQQIEILQQRQAAYKEELKTFESEEKQREEERAARREKEKAAAEERIKAQEQLLQKQRELAEAEKAREEAKRKIEAGNEVIAQLEREIALFGEMTRVEQIRFDIKNGQYQSLTQAQQQRLIQLAQEKDALEANKKAEEEAARAAEEHANEMARLGEQVFQATRTEAELLEQEMAKLNELLKAGAIDWETYGRAVKDAKDQQSELTQFGVQAARNMQTAFADLLFDPFDEGIKGMLKGFADVLRRMIADAAAAAALKEAFGFFGIPLPGAAEGGLIQAFADGGPVRGPGTGTSDSIPARLSNGEFVQPANSTSHYGADFMEAIRRRALPRNAVRGLLDNVDRMRPRVVAAPAFAEGGMPAGGAAAPVSVRTVLVDDRANIGDYLKSSEGEKVLVEFLSRNRSTARRIIGG